VYDRPNVPSRYKTPHKIGFPLFRISGTGDAVEGSASIELKPKASPMSRALAASTAVTFTKIEIFAEGLGDTRMVTPSGALAADDQNGVICRIRYVGDTR
jgi:hypothetical protein